MLNKGGSRSDEPSPRPLGCPPSTTDTVLEAKSEEKHLKQTLKDVEHATSAEEKGAKQEHHAQSVRLFSGV